MRSTQITGSTAEATLLFVWNARTQCQGPPCVEISLSVDCRGDPVICVERMHARIAREPCVEKSLSVDCRGNPVICVERTHALSGPALCRGIVVGRLQRRPCYLCGMHACIARDRLV